MRALREEIELVAPLRSTVLLTGETGSGKGLVARELHRRSGCAGPLVTVDCGALAPSLVESELFGHERGAFTGATARRLGRLERASGGTLLLDEVAELPAALQAKLLRALQDREFERLGGERTLDVRARVVAATHRDLRQEIRAGRFRQDLYFRLAVLQLAVPALRARPGDLPLLARALLERMAPRLERPAPLLTPGALARLARHPWPGNVRELSNVLERLWIRRAGRPVEAADVEAALDPPLATDELRPAEQLARALAAEGGNVAAAARALGLPRSTLRRRLRRHGLRSAASAAEQGRESVPDHQAQRDHAQDALVEAHEELLGDVVQRPAAEPGADAHRSAEPQQRAEMAREGEAAHAEDQGLGQMAEGLAARLGADQRLPRQTQVQEEGCDQGAGGAERGIEEADDSAEADEAQRRVGALGMASQQQPAGSPGRHQHEGADQHAGAGRRQLLRQPQAGEARGHQQQAVAEQDASIDVLALDQGSRSVGDELDDAVDGNRRERRQEEQHHGEQRDASGHADHGRERRGRERSDDQDRELGRLQARPVASRVGRATPAARAPR